MRKTRTNGHKVLLLLLSPLFSLCLFSMILVQVRGAARVAVAQAAETQLTAENTATAGRPPTEPPAAGQRAPRLTASLFYTGQEPVDKQTPALTVDSDNTVYGIWQEEDEEGNSSIHAGANPLWLSGTVWLSGTARVDDSTGPVYRPDLAVSQGTLYAVWLDGRAEAPCTVYPCGYDLYFATKTANGAWSQSQRINDVPQSVKAEQYVNWQKVSPSLAVDAAGNAYAVWVDDRNGEGGPYPQIYFAYRPAAIGQWQAYQQINGAYNYNAHSPAIVVDADGNAHAIWVEENPFGEEPGVFAAYRSASDGVWQPPERISNSTFGSPQYNNFLSLAVDPGGNVYATWIDEYADQLKFNERPVNGTWGYQTTIDTGAVTNIRTSGIGVNAQHYPFAAWGNSESLFLAQRLGNGQWDSPVLVEPDAASNSLSMAIDEDSTVHLAWSATISEYEEIIYTTYQPVFLSPALSELTADKPSVIADGVDTAVAIATVRDSQGSPMPDRPVTIQAASASVTVTQLQANTDANGRVWATLQSTQLQTVTVTAVDQTENLTLGQPLLLSFTHGPAATLQLSGVPTQTQTATPLSPNVTFFDATGHQVLDYDGAIHFSSSDAQATLPADYTYIPYVDEGSHTFANGLLFGTTGTQTLQVVDTSQPALSAVLAVQVSTTTGVDNVASTITFSPTTTVADGLSGATLFVSLRSSNGAPVAGQPVTVQLSPSSGLYLDGQPVAGPVHLGLSGADGQVTAVLTTTQPGLKTASACSGVVCLVGTAAVFFSDNPVDAARSSLTILGRRTVAADGQAPLYLVVTARDRFGNPLPNIATSLSVASPVIITPFNHVTDASGQARYQLVSAQPASFVVTATAGDVALAKGVHVTFMGADLAVDKTGPPDVTVGHPLTYRLTVANQGMLAATGVVITDVLPELISFVGQNSPYPHQYFPATNTVRFEIGDLPAGASVAFDVGVANSAPIGWKLVNRLQADSAAVEVDLSDNQAAFTTTVAAARPRMVVRPQYPTLMVPPGLTNTRVITIHNAGTANLGDATLTPPPHLPWVTLDRTNLGTLAPGDSATFSVTAVATAVAQNGQYRDRIRVTTSNAGALDIFLNVRVADPLRDLQLTVIDNFSHTVPNAQLILTETVYIVTEGIAETVAQHHTSYTDENGRSTFAALESGKAYAYWVISDRYGEQTGTISVTAGAGPQVHTIVLPGQAQLSVTPGALTFGAVRGDLTQQALTIRNEGTAPLTDIKIAAAGIPFLFLGRPAQNTILLPGEEVVVTVNAAPLLTETGSVVQGTVTVTAVAGQSATIPVTVRLHDGEPRTLCVRVETDLGQPLTRATIRLTDLVGQSMGSGDLAEIIQPIYAYSTDKDGPGYACFANLPTGPYRAEVGRNEVLLGEQEIDVVPGEGVQEEIMVVAEPSLITSWGVLPTPIEDVYTTVLTLTFIPYHVPQRLGITPRWIDFCGDDDGVVSQTLTVHNFYPITLTHAILRLETEGNVTARVSKPGTPPLPPPFLSNSLVLGTLPPNSHTEYILTAALTTGACNQNRHQGFIYLDVEAKYRHDAPESWYDVPAVESPPGIIPLKLINTGFPEEGNLNTIPPTLEEITLTPPQNLTWITVTKPATNVLPVGEELGFDMIVDPPPWLPEGIYYDHIQITAVNGIYTLIGIEAEMTGDGLRIKTQFVTPLRPGSLPEPDGPPWDVNVANQNEDLFDLEDVIITDWPIEAICPCLYGGGHWDFHASGLIYLELGPFHYEPDFKSNVVVLQVSQRFSLDREAFSASLLLENGLDSIASEVEVSLFFEDTNGQPLLIRRPGDPITATGLYTAVLPASSLIPTDTLAAGLPPRWQTIHAANFIAIPETPTDLLPIPAGYSQLASWTLIPDAPGLTEPAYYNVYAVIRYKANGVYKTISTLPSTISVHPQPRILLDYYLPNFVLGGEPFEWLVVATNIGYGTARNFRVETPQPKIIKQSELYPTDFEVVGPAVLEWGDVESGEQVSGTWSIVPSNPGTFVDWEAACKHQNYKGVELPPLIYCQPRVHFYDTSYLAETQDWNQKDSCGNSYQGDPVDTFSGNFGYSIQDVSIPTWGPSLAFVRSYNSRDNEDGPLGPGWTHNFNMDLVYESFIGIDENGIIGQQTYFAARLPHGSIVYFEVSPDGNTITPYPGVRATLTRDFDTYTLTQECNQTKYIYDASQKLVAIEDRNGNRLNLTYTNDRLTAVAGPADRALTFVYDAAGHIIKMTDPLSRSTVYTYTNGYLAEAADFQGNVTRFAYTPSGRLPGHLVSMTDPNGHIVFSNDYDGNGRVIRQLDGLGHPTTFAYTLATDTNERTTLTTDPLGHVLIDYYDSNGRLVRQEDAYGFAETYAYDEDDNQIQKTDKNGHTLLYSWNECGCEVDQIVDAMGNTTKLTFAGDIEITTIEDERGYVTHMTYDEHSNLLTITDPLNQRTTFTYGPHGEKLSEEDANGHMTNYGYDAYGNTAVITDALGHTTHMTYDLAGRLLSSTDALSRTTAYTYDEMDRVLTILNPLNQVTTFTYDSVGNMLSQRDALGHLTTYGYDARNNLTRITDALNGQKQMTYDANRNLETETDANGHTTTYAYDRLNRRIRVTDPLSGVVSYTYDPVGNRLSMADARGFVTHYVYDDNDRLVATVYPDGSQMTTLYDEADNAIAQTDAEDRTVSYDYDPLGRLTTQIDSLGGVTTFTYDGVGNRTAVTDAENRPATLEYDALNRLVKVTNALDEETTYAYDAVGNQVGVTDATGRITTFAYDQMDRLIAATDPLSGTSHYLYDALGNQVQRRDPLSRTTTLAYDALSRLVTETNPLGHRVYYAYDAEGNLRHFTDEEGRVTTYTYDALNRLTAVTDPLHGLTTTTYDANGNLIRQTDAEGHTTTYTYDHLNQLVLFTAPLSGTMAYTYDAVGNLIRQTDANGQVMGYTYDRLDRVVQTRNPVSGTRHYVYDGVGNLLALTDEAGHTITTTYDVLNRVVSLTNSLGHSQAYTYDTAGNLVAGTDAEGRTTTYAYDRLDRLAVITNSLGFTTTFTFDAVGNQLSLTDANGFTTFYDYDALNRLITITDALSGTTTFSYSPAGNRLRQQNPLGQTTHYGYDALNRLTQITDAQGQVSRYTYDRVGNTLSFTDVQSRTITYQYDARDRLVRVEDPLANVISFTFDAVGNQLSQTDANGRTTHYTYDTLNRLVAVQDPLAQITRFTYDAVGNQLSLTDPLTRTITFTYDAAYRLTRVTDAAGHLTRYAYDAVGNQTAVTNANGFTTTTLYDDLNRPIQIIDPLSGATSLAYDALGNLTQLTDPESRPIHYRYDPLNRLIQVNAPLSGTTTYAYDALGNLTRETDANGQAVTYQYDNLNRLIQATNPLTSTMVYTYSPAGQLLAEQNPLGQVTRYDYDLLGRLITVTDALSHTSSLGYDAVGNLIRTTDANGRLTHMAYDDLNRLTSLTNPLGQETHYEYDAVGNLTAVRDPLGHTTQQVYDDLDRLIAVIDPLSRTTTTTYDAVGNPVSLVDGNGITTRYEYDPLNRLRQVTENHIANAPPDPGVNVTTAFAYDRVGNLTGVTNPLGQTTQYQYDARNRLAAVQDPLNRTATYQYDAVGNRQQMVDPNNQVTTYAYDALNRLTTLTRPDELVQYTYDALGNRLSLQDPTGQTTYAYDGLNRLTAVTDPLSQTVQYGYDAVGNRTTLIYPGGEEVQYTYDLANQLQQVADWDGGHTQYAYDDAGRLQQVLFPNGVTGTFAYDGANQLTLIQYASVTNTLATYIYSYDQVGNRIQVIETAVAADESPTAVFTATPRIGAFPLTVTFSNLSSNASTFVWDFGDGTVLTTGSSLPLSHVYTGAGAYTVTLTAVNGPFSHLMARTHYILVAPAHAFQEIDGLVVMEAENAQAVFDRSGQSWAARTGLPGFAGSAYRQALPDRDTLYASGVVTGSPELQFLVHFVTPGVYTVWGRGSAANAAGDSLHVGLNGTLPAGGQALTGFPPRQWGWAAHTAVGPTATLTIPAPGVYTISVLVREDGLRLDRLLLTLNETLAPSGGGPAESPRVGDLVVASLTPPPGGVFTWFVVDETAQEAAARAGQLFDQTLALILSNPGALFMGPLALLAPLAYRRKRQRGLQLFTGLWLLLGMFGLGYALVHGAGFSNAKPIDFLPGDRERHGRFNPLLGSANDLGHNGALANLALQAGGARTIDYSYDPLYRLTGAAYSDGRSYGYSYDAAGNRLQALINGALVTSYSYDASNRLAQVNGQAYTYDANGNLLDDGEFTYTYDAADRLTQVADGVSTYTYIYNGDGLRVAQNVDGLRTDYVQDVAAALPQVLTARHGGTVSNYLRGLGLIGEQRGGSGPFAGPPTWQYVLPDALGSVRQLTDVGGQVSLNQEFDPFGGLAASAGSATSAYGFAGEEQDAATGLLYLRARTYNPAHGRFLQQDSVMGDPGRPRTLHRYAYAFNSPVTYTDPSGHMPGGQRRHPADNYIKAHNNRMRRLSRPRFEVLHKGESWQSGRDMADFMNGSPRRSSKDRRLPPSSGPLQGWLSDAAACSVVGSAINSAADTARDVSAFLESLERSAKEAYKSLKKSFNEEWKNLKKDAGELLHDVKDAANNVANFVKTGDTEHLEAAWQNAKSAWGNLDEVLDNPITQVALAFTPLDFVADVHAVISGDASPFELGLSLFSLATGPLGKAAFKLGRKVANYAGGFGDLFRAGRGLLGNVAGSGLVDNVLEGIDDLGAVDNVLDDVADSGLADDVLKNADELSLADEIGEAGDSIADVNRAPVNQTDETLPSGASCALPNSFVAGTLVTTADGFVPIEEIEVGDRVLGEDPETGEQGYYEVVALTDHPTNDLFQIVIGDDEGDDGQPDEEDDDAAYEVMLVTPDHPLYVEGEGWLLAENLMLGARLRRADGGMAKVLAIDQLQADTPQSVYNFTVQGPHTYFVSDEQWLVHNDCDEVGQALKAGLPHRPNNKGATSGYLFDENGNMLGDMIVSGNKQSLPPVERGMVRDPNNILDEYAPNGSPQMLHHVEFKAARYMSENELTRATLVLNNHPCEGKLSCTDWLESTLPKGSELRVIVPEGYSLGFFEKVFKGK